MAQPIAGWYPDPSGDASKLRYWDGSQWTDNYMDNPEAPTGEPVQQGEPAGQDQPVQQAAQPQYVQQTVYYSQGIQPIYPMTKEDQTLRLISFIFCVLSTVSMGWAIIPLAWCIPMTVRAWGIYKGTKPNTIAFDVCTLIFVSLVSGILLLISHKDD